MCTNVINCTFCVTPVPLLKMVPIAEQSLTAIKTCEKYVLSMKNTCLWHPGSRDLDMGHDFDIVRPPTPKIIKMSQFHNSMQNHEKHEFYWFWQCWSCCVEPLKYMWNYILLHCLWQYFNGFKCWQWGINVWHWQILDVINVTNTYFYVSHRSQVLEITKMHELWHSI